MSIGAKYTQTNIIARDWRVLARFYTEVFGCVPVPPKRDYRGKDLERGTGVKGARVTGAHLRLPGIGGDRPTLEIFNYSLLVENEIKSVNRPGLAHIAFSVNDVPAADLTP